MEKRICNLSIQAPGGTASRNSSTYKLTLPSSWIQEMGLTKEERQVEITFDGNSIVIQKRVSVDEFLQKRQALDNHLLVLSYYDEEVLCTRIVADYTEKTVCIENCISNVVKTAFGNNLVPTWEDYEEFLESRCIPRQRAGLRQYLDTLGLDDYEPLEIIRKTEGRMAEDQQWIKLKEIL